MDTIEWRELHRRASELVARVEAGGTFVVTVVGRAAAQLAPIRSTPWRCWTEVADLFDGPPDGEWRVDRDRLDGEPADPFER